MVFGCVFTFTAMAADSAAELDQVVVTATKTEQSIREVPAAVSVISREQIEKSTATTVDQLLQSVPGVYAARMDASSPNRIAQTYTRGLPGNSRTLVLLDGIPMNVLYDGQVDWSQLSTQDIERVEVVRGASSGLYGANAMGGVINVLSRAPEPGSVTRVGAEYGSLNSQRVLASHSHTFGSTSIRLSASHFSSDGYNMWRPDTTVPIANRDDMGTVKDNAGIKLIQAIDASSFVETGISYLKDEATGFYKPGAPGYQPATREQFVPTVRYVRDNDSSSTSVAVYGRLGKQWADTLNSANYRAISEKGYYEDQTVGFNAQHSLAPLAGHRLTAGLDYLDGQIDNHFDYPGTTRVRDTNGELVRYGVFLQDEIKLTERWKFNVAGRYDHWLYGGNQTDTGTGQPNTAYQERSDSGFSPKLATLFKLTSAVNLRASAGQAFNLPDMFNLYANTKRGTTTYWANPNLTPEKVNAYDAGVDIYFGRIGHVKATGYYNDAKDFIYSVQRNATNVDKINVGAVTTQGLELEGLYRPLNNLSVSASYTLNRSKIVENQQDRTLEGKSLTNVPRYWGFLRTEYQFAGGSVLFGAVTHVGKRYGNDANTTVYKSYTTLDVGGSYPLFKAVTVRLTIANVMDEQYDGIGYIAPGRTITGALHAVF
jgi:outer membrane receptor protein involved in Fe transport